MREFRSSGSVRGVPSNGHPYRDSVPDCTVTKYVARTQAPELTERSPSRPHMPESRCLSHHSKANLQMEKVTAL